jgi:phospholipid/cholesterol/gamma-HCH transport system substrate-binding protein
METRAHYVAVGAFVLAMITLAFVAVLWLGRVQLSESPERFYVFFRGSVQGLTKGAAVQYNGIPVGRVVNIRVDPDNVEQIEVTIEVDRRLVQIKSDARAQLESNILSGVSTIQVRGGTQAAGDLVPKPGHKYAVIESESSTIQQLTAAAPQLMDELKKVADNLNDLLGDQNRKAVADSLANVRTLTASASDEMKQLKGILDNANDAVVQTKSFVAAVNDSYVRQNGLRDRADRLLADADGLARSLTLASGELQTILKENRGGIHNFTQSTVAQFNDTLSQTQRLLANLSRLSGQLERDPQRLLLGERRGTYRPQ